MNPLLQDLLAGGHRLRGTHATCAVTLPEQAANELLSLADGVPKGARLEVRDGNRVAVQYPPVSIELQLPPQVDLRDTKVVPLTLSSLAVALMVRPFIKWPFVQIDGRDLRLDLTALPMPAEYRALLPFLKAATLSTTRGAIAMTLAVAVDSAAPTT